MKKKQFPTAWVLSGLVLAGLIAFFLFRKATITGRVTTGGAVSALAVSPISTGMVTVIAASALILIVIFAGIGKREF